MAKILFLMTEYSEIGMEATRRSQNVRPPALAFIIKRQYSENMFLDLVGYDACPN